MDELVDVTDVEIVGDHRLRLTFADGVVGEVSFQGRDWKGVLAPLADPDFFAKVHVDPDAGTIAWPNGIDFAPEPLYAEARKHRTSQKPTPPPPPPPAPAGIGLPETRGLFRPLKK